MCIMKKTLCMAVVTMDVYECVWVCIVMTISIPFLRVGIGSICSLVFFFQFMIMAIALLIW